MALPLLHDEHRSENGVPILAFSGVAGTGSEGTHQGDDVRRAIGEFIAENRPTAVNEVRTLARPSS